MAATKSDQRLERIESLLGDICQQQSEIKTRITQLEVGLATQRTGKASRREVIQFLDGFRAGEALGETSTGAWVEVSDTECLRGGLRTIQMREGMHARLLEERIKQLGSSPSIEIPAAQYDQAMAQAGSKEKSDAEKLLDFTKQFPDADAAIQPILDFANRLDDDPETQSLLRTIAQDEKSTLVFLGEACQLLNG